jgi:hypothetical protein
MNSDVFGLPYQLKAPCALKAVNNKGKVIAKIKLETSQNQNPSCFTLVRSNLLEKPAHGGSERHPEVTNVKREGLRTEEK